MILAQVLDNIWSILYHACVFLPASQYNKSQYNPEIKTSVSVLMGSLGMWCRS